MSYSLFSNTNFSVEVVYGDTYVVVPPKGRVKNVSLVLLPPFLPRGVVLLTEPDTIPSDTPDPVIPNVPNPTVGSILAAAIAQLTLAAENVIDDLNTAVENSTAAVGTAEEILAARDEAVAARDEAVAAAAVSEAASYVEELSPSTGTTLALGGSRLNKLSTLQNGTGAVWTLPDPSTLTDGDKYFWRVHPDTVGMITFKDYLGGTTGLRNEINVFTSAHPGSIGYAEVIPTTDGSGKLWHLIGGMR